MTTTIEVDRLVSFAELRPLFGVPYSKARLRQLEQAGKFPRRVVLSPRRVAWRASKVKAWVDSLAAPSASEQPAPFRKRARSGYVKSAPPFAS